jgi:catechol-2,3-dioxygenase
VSSKKSGRHGNTRGSTIIGRSGSDGELLHRKAGLLCLREKFRFHNLCNRRFPSDIQKICGLKPVYHFAFNIPENKFEEALERTSKQVSLLPVEPDRFVADFEAWNAKAFYFYDNNGNILEYIVRFDLRNPINKPFSGLEINSIDEIAVVTGNVEELAKRLVKKCDTELFSKQPLRDNFAAVGDDHGLLIISEENRHWYPTETPARKYFSEIKIRSGDKVFRINGETEK